MSDQYVPEVGQALFGQSWQAYPLPEWLESHLCFIEQEMERVMWNRHQREYPSPFRNTGERFENDTFVVEAYSWDDSTPQPYNFKWCDIEISWYKHVGRGATINRHVAPERGVEMLDACLASIRTMDAAEPERGGA